MYISFIFLFFDSKPGSCQPICGIDIANKSFSSAKGALVYSFRASGKNRHHLGCPNIMRSRGCAVQNKGITLKRTFKKHVTMSLKSLQCSQLLYMDIGYPCTVYLSQNHVLLVETEPCANNKTLRSVHFGVVAAELIKCKCGGIVRNEIWWE